MLERSKEKRDRKRKRQSGYMWLEKRDIVVEREGKINHNLGLRKSKYINNFEAIL